MKPIDYCINQGLSSTQLILKMQEKFPKYCKAANSMCNNSEEYGVSLSSKAQRYLMGKTEKRKRPCQLTARLLEADKEAFDKARLKRNHTIQEAVEAAVMLYIKETEDVPNP